MKRLLEIAGVLVMAGVMSGCATIATGKSQKISFDSTPEGATVIIDGKTVGQTPLSTSVKKKQTQSVLISKPGYKSITTELKTQTNPWFFGNIIIGGVFGSSTDSSTGALYQYSPSDYLVTLVPEGSAGMEAATTPSDSAKAREFIIVNYNQVVLNLTQRKGEYLTSLLDLLRVEPADREKTIEKIYSLSTVYADIPVFADRVVDLYYPYNPAIRDGLGQSLNDLSSKPTPLHPANVAGRFEKGMFTFGIDYFSKGNLDDSAKKAEEDNVFFVDFAGGDPHPSRKSTSGVGLRIGYMKPIDFENLRIGVSLGYVPSLKAKSDVYDSVFPPGNVITEIDNSYIRGLFEVGKYIPLNESVALRIGGGIGVGQAKTKQTFSGSGFYAGFDSESSNKSTGLTWELSPAMNFALGGMEWEVGVRYARFPKIKETDETYEVNYSGFGIFTGVGF